MADPYSQERVRQVESDRILGELRRHLKCCQPGTRLNIRGDDKAGGFRVGRCHMAGRKGALRGAGPMDKTLDESKSSVAVLGAHNTQHWRFPVSYLKRLAIS